MSIMVSSKNTSEVLNGSCTPHTSPQGLGIIAEEGVERSGDPEVAHSAKETVISGHNRAAACSNSWRLCQHPPDSHRLKPDKVQGRNGGVGHKILHLAEPQLAFESCWERRSQFCLTVTPGNDLTPGRAPFPRVVKPCKLNSMWGGAKKVQSWVGREVRGGEDDYGRGWGRKGDHDQHLLLESLKERTNANIIKKGLNITTIYRLSEVNVPYCYIGIKIAHSFRLIRYNCLSRPLNSYNDSQPLILEAVWKAGFFRPAMGKWA